MMKENKFPPGWNEKKVKQLIAHYEQQTEDEAVAEDEAVFSATPETVMEIPWELLPRVRELLATYQVKTQRHA
jgi:hypothetical protein